MRWRRPQPPAEDFPSHLEGYIGGPMSGTKIRIYGPPLDYPGYRADDLLSTEQTIVYRYSPAEPALATAA